MRIPSLKYFINTCKGNRGFSLVELMVVMVIVGILATGVVFMFADPTAKVKAAAFEMRGHFNLARAEAVSRNEDVRIDFDPATDSYRLWLDDWHETDSEVGPPPKDNLYTPDDPATPDKDGDTLVKEVVFRDNVKYYEFTVTAPANGPINDPQTPPISLDGKSGITLGATTLTFRSNGTCDNSGSIVVYYPLPGSSGTIKGKPYAVVVDNISTGRVILERWTNGAWSNK